MTYATAEQLEEEIRLWWARRLAPVPVALSADGESRPRWTPAYCRSVVRTSLRRLRELRARGTFVLGADLRVGDELASGELVVEVGPERTVPASVLHGSVAAEHPDGLPARTLRLARAGAAAYPVTVFHDDTLRLVRRVA